MKVIEGQGMPSYRHHDFGNLYIKFEIVFPDATWAQQGTPEMMEALKAVLPRPEPLRIPMAAHVDETVLSSVDPMQQRRAEMGTSGARANGAMDEDDDDGVPPGVQCASQ